MFYLNRDILATSLLERIGDALLSPVRYSLGRKSCACLASKSFNFNLFRRFEIDAPKAAIWKRVIAVLPSLISGPLGALVKTISLINQRTRGNHQQWRDAPAGKIALTTSGYEQFLALAPHSYYSELAHHIKNLQREQQFEVLKLCASKDGHEVLANLKTFGFTKEENFEIALAAATSVRSIEHLAGLQFSPEQNVEVAKRAIQKDMRAIYVLKDPKSPNRCGYSYNVDLQSVLDLDSNQKFEILQACPSSFSEDLIEYLSYIGLSQDQNFELLKKHTPHQPSAGINAIHSFRKIDLTQEQHREIALLALGHKKDCFSIFFGPQDRDFPSYENSLLKQFEKNWPGINSNSLTTELQKITNHELARQFTGRLHQACLYWKETCSPEALQWIGNRSILFDFFPLKPSPVGSFVIRASSEIANETQVRDRFDAIHLKLESKYPWAKLLKMPLLLLEKKGIDVKELIQQLNSFKELNTHKIMQLLQSLVMLVEYPTLTDLEKSAVVQQLSQGSLLDRSRELLMIFDFGQGHRLKEIKLGLPALGQEAFLKEFPIQKSELPEDFMQRLESTFGQYRIPDAIRVYTATLATQDDPAVTKALGEHILSVLDSSYLQKRYCTKDNPHLQKFSLETLQKWKENQELSLEELNKGGEVQEVQEETAFQWLHNQLIRDQHMDMKAYPFLQDYLKGIDCFKNLIDKIRKTKKTDIHYDSLVLQKKVIDLARSPKKEYLRLLREVEKIIPKGCEFFRQLIEKIASLSKKEEPHANFMVYETDNAEDILLSGSEVEGSCQRLDGDPHYNKGLLGYLRHGQVRLIAVKRGNGSIAARALIRLLWDGSKPVLFLERFYGNKELYPALVKMAKKTASRLKCPLTKWTSQLPNQEKNELYGKSLQCLGGPSPHEYVDAVHGIQSQGKFDIPKNFVAILK